MTAIDKYRNFAKWLITQSDVQKHVRDKADKLLKEDFKNQVRELWEFDFTNKHTGARTIQSFKEIKNNKLEFILKYRNDNEKTDFILYNWDKTDNIIEILEDYIREIEEKKADFENE